MQVMLRYILFPFLLLLYQYGFSQADYFERYKPLADSLDQALGIPAAVILAVAYHESGGGTSRHARLLNNHFGIKGKNNLRQTHGIRSQYKYYQDAEESYRGFCRVILSKKYYAALQGSNDHKKWVHAIANAGYAANPANWTQHVLQVIRRYGLVK